MIDRTVFRGAMSRLGAAVNVVTTDGPCGRYGLTASAVCSVTDDPPTLLVCINRASGASAPVRGNGVLCVNVLAAHHAALSDRFAGRGVPAEDRFADGAWTRLATGAPVLGDASAALDCRVVLVHEIGTHSVLFCEVEAARLADRAEGLIYFDRAYHPLGAAA